MSFQWFQREVALRLALFSCVLCLLWAGLACEDELVKPPPPPPPPPPPVTSEMTLTLEEAGVTDAWILLSFSDTTNPRTVMFMRDGIPLFTRTMLAKDTVMYEERLSPASAYKYSAVRVIDTTEREKSNELLVTTLGLSSHAFQWKLDTLGDGASSVLFDVAILDKDNIWAVGEINVKDSLGNWKNPPYNVARWNGQKWELSTTSDIGYGYEEIYSIFAFEKNDIWLGSSIPEHWNGQRWTFHGSTRGYKGGFRIRKIWGRSSTDLYVVGDEGNIRHYNGSMWKKLESGTTADINDIWGVVDQKTGKQTILCAVSNNFSPGERKIIRIPSIDTIPWRNDLTVHSVWFHSHRRFFACGDGVHIKVESQFWKEQIGLPPTYKERVRGISPNDVFVVGDFGNVFHFNGKSWNKYSGLPDGIFYSLDYHPNMMVTVGDVNPRAIVLRMWK